MSFKPELGGCGLERSLQSIRPNQIYLSKSSYEQI